MKKKQKATTTLVLTAQHKGSLELDYQQAVNYALTSCGVKILRSGILENKEGADWREVHVTVAGQYVLPCTCILDTLQAGHAMQLDTLQLMPIMEVLQQLTEAITTTFTLSVKIGEEVEEFVLPIELQPFDQWNGSHSVPQLLTSFITPNHPYVQQLCRTAADQMLQWTGEASMSAYQTEDPNDVRQQVAAVYEALRGESIAYVSPPASFGNEGQRVRMADIIRRDRMATCLDSTLLMAGCLEQLGINPIIVMLQEHCFVGAWLTEQMSNRSVGYDRELLLKLTADGVGQLVLVETTCICQASPIGFEEAAAMAVNQLSDNAESFVYFLDVKHCRLEHYRPLPQRMEEDGRWIMDMSHEAQPATTGARHLDHFDIDFDNDQKAVPTRLGIWERKLLDLTMANRLLHIRPGTHCVPLITLNVAELVETLCQGDSYHLLENPTDRNADVFSGGQINSQYHGDYLAPFVSNGLSEHKLYAYADSDDLATQLKNMTRQAKTNLEENGATSLFVTVGLLRWQDEEEPEQPRGGRRRRSKTDHAAPIMLLPVEIVQRQGGTGYSIHTTEDPLIFNITIFELLKQRFGIDMTNVLNLAATDGGQNDQAIDNNIALTIKTAFAAIRLALADRQGWNVHEECTLGLYSFLKFVMWNDIHQYADQLQENPVVKSLIENQLLLDDIPDADARQLDATRAPRDFALPIDVDSSQLEAIADAGDGKSFLLYGPPGTGKSQTITNMVANALYKGKRVLFVAQKMAALDVVQNRLERIGLAPFCLELHSNKATKSHVLHQFDQALQMAEEKVCNEGFDKLSEALFARRMELIGYMESLHRKQGNGRSLYDCIGGYMTLEGEEIPELPLALARKMDDAALDDACGSLEMLDAVFRLTGHPADHALSGLEPYSVSTEAHSALFKALDQLVDMVERRGVAYPADRTLAETYPADMKERYLAVEQSFFLFRSHKRSNLLKELRMNDALLQWEQIPGICQRMEQACQLQALMQEIDSLANVAWPEDREALLQAVSRWRSERLQVKNWCQWTLRRKELAEKGLTPVVDWMIEAHTSGCDAARALRKGVYHQMAMDIIATDSQLSMFNGMIFDDIIDRYRALTKDFQTLTRDELRQRLTERVARLLSPMQSAAVKEELTFLKKNIKNHGRGVSIRHILSKIQTILPDLCPCMLMSPLSVAQYIALESGKPLMDLVIFDEASQIPTSEAVGAIARGKAVVIVGDPRQMPPTAFFQAQTVGEDEAQYDDMDSILDDCIALSMPSHYLTWHYRSRHESLISFSNANYYEGKLMTFPSADDRASHVEFIPVDGTYDKGASRSNRKEAEAIVEEIVHHYSDEASAGLSLGVISFSKVQQTLIEDLLQERLNGHPALAKKMADSEEPLFIKNLENVQGDERDVILFSVGYGPDKSGNVSMNFGPLNVSGGERRLNVAVSRARQRMKVFSTMRAEQIDLSRTQAMGVMGLKNFLYFAQHGCQPEYASQQRKGEAYVGGLPTLIADQLRAKGYLVDTYVGKSSFRVDLAVVDPKNPDQYLLGILCDGKNYYATPTARDREVVQPSVLKGLGWNIERVWSVDWLNDSGAVIARIEKKMQELA